MKTIFVLSSVLAVAFGAQAQGLVYFNSGIQRISTNSVFGCATGLIGPAGSFDFALFYSTTATTVLGSTNTQTLGLSYSFAHIFAFDDPNWTLAAYGTNTSTAGRFSASAPNPDGSVTINGVAAGSSAQFVVLGWSANLGATVSAVESNLYGAFVFDAYIGESAVSGSVPLGDGVQIPISNVLGPSSPLIQGFTLGEADILIPEPSTLALAGTGIALLFLFSRKRNF